MMKVYRRFLLSRITDIEIICLKEKLDTSISACIFDHYVDYLVNSLSLSLASTHVLILIWDVNRIYNYLLYAYRTIDGESEMIQGTCRNRDVPRKKKKNLKMMTTEFVLYIWLCWWRNRRRRRRDYDDSSGTCLNWWLLNFVLVLVSRRWNFVVMLVVDRCS
jgi:hypothetical protein